MSLNIVTDPDDLLRIEIPPNVMRDIERVVRRIEGLLPSLYMGLEKVLERAPPGSPERTEYRRELSVVKKILKFLDNPGNSYLIGLPFQPVMIMFIGDGIRVIPMAVPTTPIAVLGPTKCTVLIFPSAVMFPDIALRSALVHELVHCVARELGERGAYKVDKMLADLTPDFFHAPELLIEDMLEPMLVVMLEYIKRNRVPVTDHEITDAVIDRIATDPEYANQIFSKSVIVQLKPSASWKGLL